MHAGALSQGNRFVNESLAPSAVQPKGEQMEFYGGKGPFPTPRAATKEDIADVINGFAEADIISLGKGALANHDWVNKVKNGEPLEPFRPEKVLSPNAKIKEFESTL